MLVLPVASCTCWREWEKVFRECLRFSVYLSLDLSLSRSFYRSLTEPPVSKPTPLYGQPSWWGDDDDEDHKREPGESISNHSSAGLYLSLTIQKKTKKTNSFNIVIALLLLCPFWCITLKWLPSRKTLVNSGVKRKAYWARTVLVTANHSLVTD